MWQCHKTSMDQSKIIVTFDTYHSSWWQNTHFLLPCQLRFVKLSFVKITPLHRYHEKILIFNGTFIFYRCLLLMTGISEFTNALYMESTEYLPFRSRLQRNSSRPGVNWIPASLCWRACHDANHVPMRSRLNDTFGGDEPKTSASVSLLLRAIVYKAGYCFRRAAFPNQESSQNRISEPSFMRKDL